MKTSSTEVLLALLTLSGVNPALAQGRIVVGPNVQVSKAYPKDEQNEVFLAVDPHNANRMIACTILVPRGDSMFQTQAYMTTDGGKTWLPKLRAIPDLPVADPGCAIGPDGTAYFATRGARHSRQALILYRSRDDGVTWKNAPERPFALDPLFIAVDDTDGKFRGRLYMFGAAGVPALDNAHRPDMTVWRSEDGGATLAGPVKIVSRTEKAYVLGSGNGAFFSDGTLAAAVVDVDDMKLYEGIVDPPAANAKVTVIMTSDGGETFNAVIASDWFLRPFATINPVPVVAIDRSGGPFKDRIYVAWTDVRSGRAEILVVWSSDRGKTWSKPVVVNDDLPHRTRRGPDDFMPTLAVNNRGVVGITWYDRREAKDNLGWRTRFAASFDGGDTFSPSVAVSEGMFTSDSTKELELFTSSYGAYNRDAERTSPIEAKVMLSRGQFEGGDYAGLVATPTGSFQALWVDNRTGVSQVWTAPINVTGAAQVNGSDELARLEDVSPKTLIDLEHASYQPATNVVTMDLYVANASKDTLRGPITVRILSVSSEFGDAEITNAENGERRRGATFKAMLAGNANVLLPDQRTAPIKIKIHLNRARAISPTTPIETVVGFATLRAKVLIAPSIPSK